ncbi:hypothetical protein DXD33_16405 [Phocaeicola vulgatus]|nr:hypothetical protein DXD33_16405 [Phocaeicola vulgatus]
MRSLVVSFILKRSYPYLYPFPAVWLRVFFLPVLSPQAFGVDSIVLGDNSKAYGDNSKGYGDRIHPYKKVYATGPDLLLFPQ